MAVKDGEEPEDIVVRTWADAPHDLKEEFVAGLRPDLELVARTERFVQTRWTPGNPELSSLPPTIVFRRNRGRIEAWFLQRCFRLDAAGGRAKIVG